MINCRLYVITDWKLAGNRNLFSVVKEAVSGGTTILQYREKHAGTKVMIEQANKIHMITKKAGIPLIINDRIDVFWGTGAEGIHVGQDDMPAGIARKLIGPDKILGVSASNIKQAVKAQKDGADYLGAGPIFPTLTKPDSDPPIGIEGLIKIKKAVSIPVVAIGGINKNNAREIAKIADGIAVVSAVIASPNPEKSAEELRNIINL